jgi:glycine/D-amino acid oxidase-like deaminating enzyme
MKLRSSNAFWLLKNGLINTYPSLQENISCDILVIGGGITGALISFKLSDEGYETTLIDKDDVAFGSTAATTAMLQYELDKPLYTLTKEIGPGPAADIYRAGVEAIRSLEQLIADLKVDCGFRTRDSIYVARTGADVKWLMKEFEARRDSGLDVEWLRAGDLMDKYQANGKGAIRSAVGASVDAYRLSHALLAHAVAHNGLQVFDHTAQVDVQYADGGTTSTTDGGFTIRAKWIVYATGYETQSFFKEKIVDLVSTYVCISEPLDQVPESLSEAIFWTTDKPYLYMRSTPEGRVLVGGADEPFKDAGKRDKLIEEKEHILLRLFHKVMPDLKLVPDFSWAGTFGVTPDTLPYIGPHKDFPKSLFVLGYGGNGIIFSVLAMNVISDAIAGRHNKFLDYLGFNR